MLDNGTLLDIKRTSVWSAIDGLKPEWTAQINGYAMLCREHGVEVSELKILPWYRDWSKTKAAEDSYPSTAAETLPVPMWSDEQARSYFQDRILAHRAAAAGDIPECSPEERWQKPHVYALTKIGAAKATKLCATQAEAEMEALLRTPKGGDPAKWFYTQERKGSSPRCEAYCSASKWCSQWAKMQLAAKGGDSAATEP